MVRKWFAEAGYPNADRAAILPVATLVSVLKASYEWKRKDGDIHPNLIAEASEIDATAEAAKTIQRRLRKLALAYDEDKEPLPPELARLGEALEGAMFYLSPMDSAFLSHDRWWQHNIELLRDNVVMALRLAGRDPKDGDGRDDGPVAKIIAKAWEFIDGKYVPTATAHSRLKRLNAKRKRLPARAKRVGQSFC
jgi:hypothetical protein